MIVAICCVGDVGVGHMRKGKAPFRAPVPLGRPLLSLFLFLSLFLLLVCLPNGSARHDDMNKERTLAMIKPDGLFGNYTDKIKGIILESGYDILKEIMVPLNEGNATLFYAEHSAKSFFPRLIEYMTSGPVIVMVLEKSNAISDWRALIGPTDPSKAKVSHPSSIRAMCGIDIERNCVHGSDSAKSASKEITFFFGERWLSSFSDYLDHRSEDRGINRSSFSQRIGKASILPEKHPSHRDEVLTGTCIVQNLLLWDVY